MGTDRFYRQWVNAPDLVSFEVKEDQTDLFIRAQRELKKEAAASVARHRHTVESYISRRPEFQTALSPIATDNRAPALIRAMLEAAQKSDVGPMAGIAGAMAAAVGTDLLPLSDEVIVENGGDIFLRTETERILGIFASDSPVSRRVGVKIRPRGGKPVGVCTSSGTVGHSLSFGKADAALIVSHDTILADCVATKIGNIVKAADDIEEGIAAAKAIEGILGVVVIIGDKLGSWGEIEFVSIERGD